MGTSTAFDVLVSLAREQASASPSFDNEAAAEAVVPLSRRALSTTLERFDGRDDVRVIPGEWAAVRRWLVLTVAAHLDVEPVGA